MKESAAWGCRLPGIGPMVLPRDRGDLMDWRCNRRRDSFSNRISLQDYPNVEGPSAGSDGEAGGAVDRADVRTHLTPAPALMPCVRCRRGTPEMACGLADPQNNPPSVSRTVAAGPDSSASDQLPAPRVCDAIATECRSTRVAWMSPGAMNREHGDCDCPMTACVTSWNGRPAPAVSGEVAGLDAVVLMTACHRC